MTGLLPAAGPLDPLLRDPEVTEILVNGPDDVWVEAAGRLIRVDARFDGPAELRRVAARLVAACGRRIDDASPLVDARLPDGSRVNAVLPPVAVDGPLLTIRRFAGAVRTLSELERCGSIDAELHALLVEIVRSRLNVLISGGTSTGKTTTLAALTGAVRPSERIVTVEDAAELRLQAAHVARLEARPAGVEGRGAIDLRTLVRNALRMRPDRLVVGEVRGGEALDLMLAMNTGHDGSMTTVHANTAADAVRRLETMALMGGVDVPHAAVREQIASALHVVVHQDRTADGARRVVDVVPVLAESGGWRIGTRAELLRVLESRRAT